MVKLVITMDFESIIPSSSLGKTNTFARLAQLVERNALNVVVEGSSPSMGVSFFSISSVGRAFDC